MKNLDGIVERQFGLCTRWLLYLCACLLFSYSFWQRVNVSVCVHLCTLLTPLPCACPCVSRLFALFVCAMRAMCAALAWFVAVERRVVAAARSGCAGWPRRVPHGAALDWFTWTLLRPRAG